MATLTRDQIAMYAQAAGLSAADAKTATAIALAESGGNPQAHNGNAATGDDSYGLWQINMTDAAGGPSRRRRLGLTSDAQLFDPAVNARAMAMISSNGRDFTPWTTYTSGAYKRAAAQQAGWEEWFLPPALGLAPEGSIPGVDTGGGLESLAELAVGAGEWLSKAHNWVRVAQVVSGGALVLVGLSLAFKGQLGPVAGAVTSVVPELKVANIANQARKGIKAKKAAGKPPAAKKPAAPAGKTEAAA